METPIGSFPIRDLVAGLAIDEGALGGVEVRGAEAREGVVKRKSFKCGAHLGDFAHHAGIDL